MKLTVCICCFNEKPTILGAIEEAKALPVKDKEIIVIDNCSTDGTKEILAAIKDDSLRIVLKDKNYGPGHSGKMSLTMAQGEYYFAPGADMEYSMSDAMTMLKVIEEKKADVVFGSRLAGNKKSWLQLVKERPFWLGTFIGTSMVNILFRKKFTDIIATKLIKTDVLKNLDFQSNGHASEFELVSRLCKKGYKIEEVPVSYKPRTREQGKTIKVFDMLPAMWVIIKIKFFTK